MQLYPTGCMCSLKYNNTYTDYWDSLQSSYKNDRFISPNAHYLDDTHLYYIGDAFHWPETHSLARNNTTHIRDIEKLRRLTLIRTDYDY